MATMIALDAGHGGYDMGAVFQGRKEKEDTLNLTRSVGEQLREAGYEVLYTRTTDVYQSPFEKAQIANQNNADYFISFHRNSGPMPNGYRGVESLVFSESDPVTRRIAEDINDQLERVGFLNLGIEARPNLVVLRKTSMPAVLVEVGFLNSDEDNRIFDESFSEVVDAICAGIMEAIPLVGKGYAVQIGLFKYESNADYQAELAKDAGYEAEIMYEEPYYAVRIPVGESLDEAAGVQARLKKLGFDTLIVSK
ncbi:N-acetylmuramoyl-L-alanine amidase [Lachnospiraceae bacterium XBB1006]|nr:N-acetylmuramoyl-L-alanine amidase [Lachnospiraceae bacterium XBB1006]